MVRKKYLYFILFFQSRVGGKARGHGTPGDTHVQVWGSDRTVLGLDSQRNETGYYFEFNYLVSFIEFRWILFYIFANGVGQPEIRFFGVKFLDKSVLI